MVMYRTRWWAWLPVCVFLSCGCLPFRGEIDSAAAPPTATHAYWREVNQILSQKPAGNDMKSMVQLLETQVASLRELPTEGVDGELVTAVQQLIQAEEEVLWQANTVDRNPEFLRQSRQLSELYADANRQAAQAKKKLKELRSVLNKRYGGGFGADW
ncbi:MAG: hypothetical protein RMJ56_02410 [Gemmataceae bacterium]|nr:hypothetical protein [Gemmata sp.]MDW8196439.1 hypothetical protein [Gemmataceae bacterium]